LQFAVAIAAQAESQSLQQLESIAQMISSQLNDTVGCSAQIAA
jgi:hypothetical protein